MTHKNAETEINRLMLAAIDDLEAETAANKMNQFVAKQLGAVAGLLGYPDILRRVEACLAELPPADFFRGAITNIDWQNLEAKEIDWLRRIESVAECDASHPVCSRDAAVPELARFAEASRHLRLCLQGDLEGAIAAAMADSDFEEIADTLAALGKFDEALMMIDSQQISEGRKRGVRIVVLVEKCRRLMPTFAEAIASFDPKNFDRLHVILALAQRRPWACYPYPDY